MDWGSEMRAPLYSRAVSTIATSRERFRASDDPASGGAVGMGMIRLGRAVAPADERQTILALSENSAARARALRDRAALDDLIAAYRALPAREAIARQREMLDAIDRLREAADASLGSPGMAAAFDELAGPHYDRARADVLDHVLAQTVQERHSVLAAELAATQARAARNWQDPDRFSAALDEVADAARAQAREMGANAADPVGPALAEAIDAAAHRALDAGEPDFAAHLAAAFGDLLPAQARNRLLARLSTPMTERDRAALFAQAIAGEGDASDSSPQTIAIVAPAAAAIHPAIGGRVEAVDGTGGHVRIAHPDGTSALYEGLGLAAVSPGEQVTPASVIGSAGPACRFTLLGPDGMPADPCPVLPGGVAEALVGPIDTPRQWDAAIVLARIAARNDLAPEARDGALIFARQRMADDARTLAERDRLAGRAAALHAATATVRPGSVADLPGNIVRQLSPASLARIDDALRQASEQDEPAPDGPVTLELEIQRRRYPDRFAKTDLSGAIGRVRWDELAQLAQMQEAMTSADGIRAAAERRSAMLDSLAAGAIQSGDDSP